MWLVQRCYDNGVDCWKHPFFVTADRELAQTTVDLLNANLAEAKEIYAQGRIPYPHRGGDAVLKKYWEADKAHTDKINALVLEYDPDEGDVYITEYQVVEIEHR